MLEGIGRFFEWLFEDVLGVFGITKAVVAITESQNLSRAGAINAIADLAMFSLAIVNTIAMYALNRPDDITRGYDRFIVATIGCVLIVVSERIWRIRNKND